MKGYRKCNECSRESIEDEGCHFGSQDHIFVCKECASSKREVMIGQKWCQSRDEEFYSCMHFDKVQKLLVQRLEKINDNEYLMQKVVETCPFCGFSYQPDRLNKKTSKEDAIVETHR